MDDYDDDDDGPSAIDLRDVLTAVERVDEGLERVETKLGERLDALEKLPAQLAAEARSIGTALSAIFLVLFVVHYERLAAIANGLLAAAGRLLLMVVGFGAIVVDWLRQ